MVNDDLISRAELAATLGELTFGGGDLLHTDDVMDAIKAAPAVDAVPVVHGRWITDKYGETVCSECDNNALQVLTGCWVNRHFEPHKSKCCPNCGARMDGERRDSE